MAGKQALVVKPTKDRWAVMTEKESSERFSSITKFIAIRSALKMARNERRQVIVENTDGTSEVFNPAEMTTLYHKDNGGKNEV